MGGKKGNQSKKGVGKRLSQSKGVKLPKASKKSSKASLNKKVSGLLKAKISGQPKLVIQQLQQEF